MTPKIITYIAIKDQIKVAIEAGVEHLILDDPKCSARSFVNPETRKDFDILVALAKYARSLNPDVELSVNCDILCHHKHFPMLTLLIMALKKAKVELIRVQDVGIFQYIKKHYPEAKFILDTQTGNQNQESLEFYAQHYQGQVLSNEMPYPEIKKLGNIKCDFEVQVQGPILIQYSYRRYLAGLEATQGQTELSQDDIKDIYREAQDADYLNRFYPFYDNQHGHFMYLYFDRCLAAQLDALAQCPLSGWVVDCRGESFEYFKAALVLYKQAQKLFISSKFDPEPLTASYENFLKTTQRPQRPGFFLANKTDQDLSKSAKILSKEDLGSPYGTIIDYTKGKWVIVELVHPINNKDNYLVLTPEGGKKELEPLEIRTLLDEDIVESGTDRLVKVRWQKGFQPKGKIYIC